MVKRKRKRLGELSNDIKYSCELNLMDCSAAAFTSKRNVSHRESEKRCRALISRCEQLNYKHVAISHTAYGRLKLERDSVEQAFPVVEQIARFSAACHVYRRINVVIENPADVRLFTSAARDTSSMGNNEDNYEGAKDKNLQEAIEVLKGYDIVALIPKNESTLTSICQSARRADIVVLDYASGRGGRLSYTLRASDLQAASELGIAFEVCYSPMLVDPAKRKTFIQTIRNFTQATLSVKPKPNLIVSSGSRINPENSSDYGQLALRSSSDMVSVLREFSGLDQKSALASVTIAPRAVLDKTRRRKNALEAPLSVSLCRSIKVCESDSTRHEKTEQKVKVSTTSKIQTKPSLLAKGELSNSDDENEGFIAF